MADFAFTLTAAPILGGVDHSIGDNRIVERNDLAIVSLATPLGGGAALAQAAEQGWGIRLPEPGMSTTAGDTRAIWTAPDQVLLIFPHTSPNANAVAQDKLAGTGYTTEQTDVWVVLEVSGPQTRAALERLCPLDTAQMTVDAAGRTVMEHMGAIIVRLESDRYLLMSASSSALSFLHAVETSYRYVAE